MTQISLKLPPLVDGSCEQTNTAPHAVGHAPSGFVAPQ